MTRRNAAAGFTLIELLVAIAVLAMMAVFAWRGLDQVVRTREALQQSQEMLDGVQRLFANIARDAAAARDIRIDAAGQISFLTVPHDAPFPGPGQSVEPVVPVQYRLEGDRVVRRGGDAVEEVLLARVSEWSGALYRADGSWGLAPEGGARDEAPTALRVGMRLQSDGAISRIFLLRE